MPRKKKPEVAPVVPAEPPKKPRYKKYWVQLRDGRGNEINITLPPDAPVKVTDFGRSPTLMSLSDVEPWNDMQFFWNGAWYELRVEDPPQRHTFHVEFDESQETSDPVEKVAGDIRARYGSRAKVTHVSTVVLAELDE